MPSANKVITRILKDSHGIVYKTHTRVSGIRTYILYMGSALGDEDYHFLNKVNGPKLKL